MQLLGHVGKSQSAFDMAVSIKVPVESSTYPSVIYLTLDQHARIFRCSRRKEKWSDSRSGEIIMLSLGWRATTDHPERPLQLSMRFRSKQRVCIEQHI